MLIVGRINILKWLSSKVIYIFNILSIKILTQFLHTFKGQYSTSYGQIKQSNAKQNNPKKPRIPKIILNNKRKSRGITILQAPLQNYNTMNCMLLVLKKSSIMESILRPRCKCTYLWIPHASLTNGAVLTRCYHGEEYKLLHICHPAENSSPSPSWVHRPQEKHR